MVELDRFVVVTKPGSCEQIIKSKTERKTERSDDWYVGEKSERRREERRGIHPVDFLGRAHVRALLSAVHSPTRMSAREIDFGLIKDGKFHSSRNASPSS